MTREVWRPVKDFPDYEVSTVGRVRRRVDSPFSPKAGHVLKPWLGVGGVMYVALRRAGMTHARAVHVIHDQAFGAATRHAS